ncbi:hypothetical protein B0H13DRAFT_2260784, partial [Mycena leptocephala]
MILLLTPTPERSNDASVAKFTHSPPYIPGPYTRTPPASTLPYVPSLAWFCLRKLAQLEAGPDQISAIVDVRLHYQPPASKATYDLLHALIPSLSLPEFDWASVDPRLWITIVQIYDNLPLLFQSYQIPLADKHLPLLQRVKSTTDFSLVTILELPGCRELSDTTIVNLKHLHTLIALDATATDLSAYGLKVLSGTVLRSDEDQTRRGPWGLRILRLRNCRRIDDKLFSHLSPFLLLSILDLRGTQCHSNNFFPTFQPAPPTEYPLYHPTPLRLSVDLLCSTCGLFSSPNVFAIYINTLHHPVTAFRPVAQETHLEDVCVTFNPGSNEFVVGSSTEAAKPQKRVGRFPRETKPKIEDCHCPECSEGESHRAGPRHRPIPTQISDLSLHNRVAEQEISAHAAMEDTMSFYRSANVARSRNSFRGYSYPSEAPLPPSVKDEQLMLYRPPPPWVTLEATAPDVQVSKPTGPPAVVTGLSKRKKAEMAEYAEQLNEKRRKIQRDAATRPTVCVPETVSLSRNPFRRKVDKQDSLSSEAASSVSMPLDRSKDGVGTEMEKVASPTVMNQSCASASSLCERKDPGTHDREKLAPKVQRKPAFDWDRWGKK